MDGGERIRPERQSFAGPGATRGADRRSRGRGRARRPRWSAAASVPGRRSTGRRARSRPSATARRCRSSRRRSRSGSPCRGCGSPSRASSRASSHGWLNQVARISPVRSDDVGGEDVPPSAPPPGRARDDDVEHRLLVAEERCDRALGDRLSYRLRPMHEHVTERRQPEPRELPGRERGRRPRPPRRASRARPGRRRTVGRRVRRRRLEATERHAGARGSHGVVLEPEEPDRAGAGVRADDGPEGLDQLDRRGRPRSPTRSVSTSTHSGAFACAIATPSPGPSTVFAVNSRANSSSAFCRPRTRATGTTSPSATERIGFTLRSAPARACALPMRPPRCRNSSVSSVKTTPFVALKRSIRALDLGVGRASPRAAARSPGRAGRSRARRSRRRRPARCRRRARRQRAPTSQRYRRACRRGAATRSARTRARASSSYTVEEVLGRRLRRRRAAPSTPARRS